MQIRPAQIEAFEAAATDECAAFVSAFVRENAPDAIQALPPQVFESRIHDGIEHARHYELEIFADIATFVYLLFKVGPDFAEFPFFHSVLTDEDIDADDRMATLVETAGDEDWFEAHDISDPRRWEQLVNA